MVIHNGYNKLFSLVNIFRAWRMFRLGKTRKYDVLSFECHLEDNLFELFEDLSLGQYVHLDYTHFKVFDSKKRDIHKAYVRDRIVHQIIFDYLEEIYEPLFISDTYSSRKYKGSHKAVATFKYFAKLIQSDKRSTCFVLKCDVRKYFNSVDKDILLLLISKKVTDQGILAVISNVIYSFEKNNPGVPLGNITSQVFANIYLHELDEFIKEDLGVRFYIRYNDDFVILDNSEKRLMSYLPKIRDFLTSNLKLEIPESKSSIRKLNWGIDFLGYTILKNAVLLRNETKGKLFARINRNNTSSYLGLLKHCNSYTLTQKIISGFNSRTEFDILGDFLFE